MIKYLSDTNGGQYDRAIAGYEFDTGLYETELQPDICSKLNILGGVLVFRNSSGYAYCTGLANKDIQQLCPSGTQVIDDVAGCANTTTNVTVFTVGSRCAPSPCQNRGLCFDFSSADAYHCHCPYPYVCLHCQTQDRECAPFACGRRTLHVYPMCRGLTLDKALPHICSCMTIDPWNGLFFALNNCYEEKIFYKKCDGKEGVGAVSFTNKAFYMCRLDRITASIYSCNLDHV